MCSKTCRILAVKLARFSIVNVFAALVPEAPTNLQVAAESTTSIRVTWDSPDETNGPIVTYKVGLLPVAP